MTRKYYIRTFGCAQNEADSQRIAAYLKRQGYKRAKDIKSADYIVVNTCMIREMAENRVYGLINNLRKTKDQRLLPCSASPAGRRQAGKTKIVLTGCMVGMAVRDKSGKFLKLIKKKLPAVDEFLPIEEIGFDIAPLRTEKKHALVPISNGCNNFCTYCVVPYTRGREVSRAFDEVIVECKQLIKDGYEEITLIGQNVNSYGADLLQKEKNLNNIYPSYAPIQSGLRGSYTDTNSSNRGIYYLNKKRIRPVLVKHLGKYRIPTLFPYLLQEVAKLGFRKISFISSNPWDFSDELIKVINDNPSISREIHLPVQSGSSSVLKRMNRWYTAEQYLALISKLKSQIPASPCLAGRQAAGRLKLKISTDIIVGFCGETDDEFQQTVDLCKKVGFSKAYIAMYSDRPMTAAHKAFKDDVPHKEKKRRWKILEDLINKPYLYRK